MDRAVFTQFIHLYNEKLRGKIISRFYVLPNTAKKSLSETSVDSFLS